METADTIIVDEILSILKLAEYPSWSQPIALDRRDTALYIQRIIDKFEEVNIEAYEDAEDEIKGMESDMRDIDDEIRLLRGENLFLERENRSLFGKNEALSRKLLSNKIKGEVEDGR